MKKLLPQRQSTAGFTFLELLIVVVMIAILFGIAAPSWLGLANRQRSADAREQILQAIRLAQTEAIRTRRDQTVLFNTGVNPPTITYKGATTPVGNGRLRPGMVGLQTPVTSITFDADGNVKDDVAPPVVFTVKAPATNGRSRCLVVQTILGATRSIDAGEPGCT